MKKTTLFSASLIFFSSFLSVGAAAQVLHTPQMESLIGHMTSVQGIHIQVKSNGCTDKKDFYVSQATHGRAHVLSFYRLRVDLCRAYLPYGKVITFSFDELGIQSSDVVEISNPDVGVSVY